MRNLKIMFIYNEVSREELLNPFLKLMNQEWEIDFYHDGITALEAISDNYDIIISEFNLPVVTGITILNYVKIFYPNIKRILLASYFEIDEFDSEMYYEYNIIDVFIRRPFIISNLVKVIKILNFDKYFFDESMNYVDEMVPIIEKRSENELL